MKRGSLKRWAALLKGELLTVYYAARDPEAPWLARFVAIAVAAYALSPIDLIPDFIPVIGYLDDLLIVPLGLLLVIRLAPRYDRLHLGWVSLVVAVGACVVNLAPGDGHGCLCVAHSLRVHRAGHVHSPPVPPPAACTQSRSHQYHVPIDAFLLLMNCPTCRHAFK